MLMVASTGGGHWVDRRSGLGGGSDTTDWDSPFHDLPPVIGSDDIR